MDELDETDCDGGDGDDDKGAEFGVGWSVDAASVSFTVVGVDEVSRVKLSRGSVFAR